MEESPLKNRKNPVRSRKKMQKKRVDDDYEESDEESPDRNRKKSACSPRKTQKNHVDSDEDYEEADEKSPDRNRKKSACSSRKTQKNHVDSDEDYEEADEEGPSTSRIRLRNIEKIDKETLIHKCVYYLLIADQKKHAIKRTDIMKHVIKGPQQLYSNVIDGANEVLKKTYGMEITYLRKGNLMLVNNLTQELDVQQYSCLSGVKKQQQGLILYLLLIIYMNENSISENDLWKALVPLGINPSTQKSHPIFGDVQKYINSELVKQMYLDYVCISKDPPHYEYRWGPRAESEVDKSDLLHFACLVLDKKPEDWILQYKDATESAETQDSVENS
ncbi:Melanoma-associated antigen D2, partial [Stegodyphus mimosarum]